MNLKDLAINFCYLLSVLLTQYFLPPFLLEKITNYIRDQEQLKHILKFVEDNMENISMIVIVIVFFMIVLLVTLISKIFKPSAEINVKINHKKNLFKSRFDLKVEEIDSKVDYNSFYMHISCIPRKKISGLSKVLLKYLIKNNDKIVLKNCPKPNDRYVNFNSSIRNRSRVIPYGNERGYGLKIIKEVDNLITIFNNTNIVENYQTEFEIAVSRFENLDRDTNISVCPCIYVESIFTRIVFKLLFKIDCNDSNISLCIRK